MKRARKRGKQPAKAPVRLLRTAAEALEKRQIAIDAIDWSSAVRPLSAVHVGRLGDASQLPAISVWEFEPGRYRGIDGHHRWRLAKARGEKTVGALVRHFPPGKEGDKAFDFACVQSNLQHGLPLTREERDRAILRIWSRWGQTAGRAGGETLEDLGALFNLTKQRIHQIISMKDIEHPAALSQMPKGPPTGGPRTQIPGRRPSHGHFSRFGRFSAGTRRLSRLLGDAEFVGLLLREHQSEVLKELEAVRGLIDQVLRSRADNAV